MSTLPLSLKEHGWLRRHFIAIIALAAFLFMAMLNFEQGRVITNQRMLIAQLFGDSLALTHMRTREGEQQWQQRRSGTAGKHGPVSAARP